MSRAFVSPGLAREPYLNDNAIAVWQASMEPLSMQALTAFKLPVMVSRHARLEVVLFLQSYYLRLGGQAVLMGALPGLFFTGIVAALTFVVHRHLPYRKMLVLTGALLGGVLLVMVGEEAQEMQLAHWLSTTMIPALAHVIPAWAGLWFSVFPTVETLAAQAIAAITVIGSYFLARGKPIGAGSARH
jgi:high-affinity iron transporter